MDRTRDNRRRTNHYKSLRLINLDRQLNHGSRWYEFDGQYRKGKIHCSCPLCAAKSKRSRLGYLWKHSDQLKIDSMNDKLKEELCYGSEN